MAGELNIAVVRFDAVDEHSVVRASEQGTEIASAIAEQLPEALPSAATFAIEIRLPTQIGRLDGSEPATRAASARRLAERLHAHIVLYGLLRSEPTGLVVTPEFFVHPSLVPNAEELAGTHDLGAPIGLAGVQTGPALRREAREQVNARTQALAWLASGLGRYASGRFDLATADFLRAEGAVGWRSDDGEQVVELLLGNAAGHLRRYSAAARRYEHSLALDPQYARAWTGLAEARFHLAAGSGATRCERGGVAAERMFEALRTYERARSSAHRPTGSDLDVRIDFGAARTLACLSQAGLVDRWGDAARLYREVIAAWEAGETHTQLLAADAWAGLGLAMLPTIKTSNPADSYRRALEAYGHAADLTEKQTQRGQLTAQIGHIRCRLGELDQARAAYEQAARLDPTHATEYLRLSRRSTC
jgi:tetratricopeptide (TPR) repeat protein